MLCQGLDLNIFISVSALMLHPLQSQVKPNRGRSSHICLKTWRSCSKQSFCQRLPAGAKGMWKILATMTAAVMEAVCYLLISGYFSNSISWAGSFPCSPQPPWRQTVLATEYYYHLECQLGPIKNSCLAPHYPSFIPPLPFPPRGVSSLELLISPQRQRKKLRGSCST